MEQLGDDALADHHARDTRQADVTSTAHDEFLGEHAPLHDEDAALPGPVTGSAASLMSAAESEDDSGRHATLQPLRAPRRRKIGKALQLVLLRKYVNCAKELRRLPDRPTTEHLLDEAYDEFYFHGGSLHEPRLGLQETRKRSSEQQEIHSLVDELESLRQRWQRSGTATSGSDTAETDGGGASSDFAARPSSPSPAAAVDATIIDGEEHVLVAKKKLELMLRFTQETLVAQQKLLAQVALMEQHLAELQSQQHPLGH